ncbi:MAG: transglycosylase SLT domain-containing protein, partial [Motiliproteus sp.]|nr:transglycosylase SLT domain-containing protein [Motiliproteus sp.]
TDASAEKPVQLLDNLPPLDPAHEKQLTKQRLLYTLAQKAFKAKQSEKFASLSNRLKDYPLYPYLEYQRLTSNLKALDSKTMVAFDKHFADNPLPQRLRQKWLSHLARSKRWNSFLTHFPQSSNSTVLNCQRLWALHKTGRTQQALFQVKDLWMVGKSQPKQCDQIFNAWIKSSQFDEKYAWQRFWLALERGKRSLARYLIRHIKTPTLKKSAQTALSLHRLPQRLAKTQLSPKQPGYDKTVHITLRRLIRKDAASAMKQWQKLSPTLTSSRDSQAKLKQQLGLYLLRSFNTNAGQWLDLLDRNFQDPELNSWRLRFYLSQQDWPSMQRLFTKLSAEELKKNSWGYWKARTLAQMGDNKSADKLFNQLAQKRSFYGFLSADRLSLNYQLNDNSQAVEKPMVDRLSTLSALSRARELSYHGQPINARREWWRAGLNLSKPEHHVAALIANRWGLHNLAIRSAISGGQWDNLELRFPTPYGNHISANAKRFSLEEPWIYAVSRQESAFAVDVRSHAGAVGLMQLMPATAKQTARKINVKYRGSFQLKKPEYNVRLGSAYLSQMHKRFNNNRIFATAAYNAGPHRVDLWLKQRGQLPLDAWVETIPFNETRNYVQNVLSFAVIYSDLMGKPMKFMRSNELALLNRP